MVNKTKWEQDGAKPLFDRQVLSGEVKEWVKKAKGTNFTCSNCGKVFKITEDEIGVSCQSSAPSSLRNFFTKLGNKFGVDISKHHVSGETVDEGLFDKNGRLVVGIITCPYCYQQHGHYYDSTRKQITP